VLVSVALLIGDPPSTGDSRAKHPDTLYQGTISARTTAAARPSIRCLKRLYQQRRAPASPDTEAANFPGLEVSIMTVEPLREIQRLPQDFMQHPYEILDELRGQGPVHR